MREQGNQVRRRHFTGRAGTREPRENTDRARAKRVACGIICDDIPAQQFRAHPPRERAIRRDERCGAPRCFQNFPHGNGESERLFAFIAGLDQTDVLKCRRKFVGAGGSPIGDPLARRLRRSQSLR